jgi:hypothetical protein
VSGYSGKPLTNKLGYKPGQYVCLISAPDWYEAALKAAAINSTNVLPADWLHGFFANQADLREFLSDVELPAISCGLWVSWPKKASKVATDLSEQTFRDLILPLGWVDTKVAAIDGTWSGLKFLRRKA